MPDVVLVRATVLACFIIMIRWIVARQPTLAEEVLPGREDTDGVLQPTIREVSGQGGVGTSLVHSSSQKIRRGLEGKGGGELSLARLVSNLEYVYALPPAMPSMGATIE